MKRLFLIVSLLAGLGMSGCQVYRAYQRPDLPEVDSLYRQPVPADTASLADLTWRELFTDPLLQRLIDSGLVHNSDLRIAQLRATEAQASLTAARLAYLPSVSLTPQGTVNAAGAIVTNPGQWLFTAVGSLVEPLFARGRNRANLKIARAQQEEALVNFRQSLLTAGAEVNDALVQWQTARQSLLQAELDAASDRFDAIQGVINLYHALGGGY